MKTVFYASSRMGANKRMRGDSAETAESADARLVSGILARGELSREMELD
jgi:hypothetical protein